jgi:hypothetical protein
MRRFFWAGTCDFYGGLCLLVWELVCRPLQYRGLGIKNLAMHGLALKSALGMAPVHRHQQAMARSPHAQRH